MLIVDTHCHALPHWFEPVEVLLHQMHANGGGESPAGAGAWTVLTMRYLIECVRRFPGRFSPIIIVDTDQPGRSASFRAMGSVKALKVSVSLRPSVRQANDSAWRSGARPAEFGCAREFPGLIRGFYFAGVRPGGAGVTHLADHRRTPGRDWLE